MKSKKIIQKPFRIRPKAYEVYKFLEYYHIRNDMNKNVFDSIVNYSLDYLNDKKYCPSVIEFLGKREVKGFSLSVETLEALTSFHLKNPHILVAECIELFIYLYAKNVLSEEELKYLDINYIEDRYTRLF